MSVQIQYARSETHLIEQLDNMCEKMNNYAESTDPKTGKKSYIRTSSRSGEAVTLSNVAISGDIAQKLKHAVGYACFLFSIRLCRLCRMLFILLTTGNRSYLKDHSHGYFR